MDQPRLAPFRPGTLTVGLYRLAAGKIDVRVQRELLSVLHMEYPSLDQVPGGIQFSDKYKGKSLTVDLAKVEIEDQDPDSHGTAIQGMTDVFKKVLENINFPAPYRVRLQAQGTIQGMEDCKPEDALRARFGPPSAWFQDVPGGEVPQTGVRYVMEGSDASLREYRIEPWFTRPGHFFVSSSSFSGGAGKETLNDALTFARDEAERVRLLSDRIAADIVKGTA